MTTKIHYRHVRENQGGTFTFDPESASVKERLTHAGTTGCITCVGVYLPISTDRYFLAHINAYVRESRASGGWNRITTQLNEHEKNEIQQKVFDSMHQHAKMNNWRPRDIMAYCINSGTARPIIVWPRRDSRDAGAAVIEGIRRFLDIRNNSLGEYVRYNSGFVVDLRDNSQVSYFSDDQAVAREEEEKGYEKVPEGIGTQWEVCGRRDRGTWADLVYFGENRRKKL